MTFVVHLSADFPDSLNATKTRAIDKLVNATQGPLEHRVYSLNRYGGIRGWLRPGTCEIAVDDGRVASLRYDAPGNGLNLVRAMNRVADFIAADLSAKGLRPAMVHGHKLSVEGLAASALARKLGVPFALSLQGNSDKKIVGARPDLRARYRHCWREAAVVFPFAPWIADWCANRLGHREGPIVPLPCMVSSEAVLAPSNNASRVITAFNFNDWRNKNIATLVRAVALAAQDVGGIELHIAGSGSDESLKMVKSIVADAGIASLTVFHGWISPDRIQQWMNDAAVFAMPSRRESFGMVFVEALFGGVPIVYPREAAVDGFFDGECFASSVEATDAHVLAATLTAHLRESAERKHALGLWQSGEGMKLFKADTIAGRYVDAVRRAAAG